MINSNTHSSPTLIQSVDNPLAKQWLELHTTKGRELAQSYMAEGIHLVQMAHEHHFIKELIALDGFELPLEWRAYPRQWVSEKVMKKVSQLMAFSPIIAICTMHPSPLRLGNKVLVIDGVQDPGNLGTILRSAVAFGVDHVVVSKTSVDAYHDKVIRGSQGALFALSITREDSLAFVKAHQATHQVIVTSLHPNAVSTATFKFPPHWMLVMGNEGQGVQTSLIELADSQIMLPMSGHMESLNVAIATSILLYLSFTQG